MKFLRFNLGLLLALSIFITSVIPQNVQAATLTDVRIDEVFDRFHYAINVEWDQQDVAFKEQAAQDLKTALLALEASGVTMEEIQQYIQETFLDARTRSDYERLIAALKTQNVSQKEATLIAMKFMSQNMPQGMNFNGEGVMRGGGKLTLIVAVLVVVVVTHLLFRKSGHDDHHDDDDGDTVIIIVD